MCSSTIWGLGEGLLNQQMRYKPGIAGELIIPRQKEPLRMKPMQTMQSLERDAT